MNEVKNPKKPLIYYACIVAAVLLAFNLIVAPAIMRNQVEEVDYGKFRFNEKSCVQPFLV